MLGVFIDKSGEFIDMLGESIDNMGVFVDMLGCFVSVNGFIKRSYRLLNYIYYLKQFTTTKRSSFFL